MKKKPYFIQYRNRHLISFFVFDAEVEAILIDDELMIKVIAGYTSFLVGGNAMITRRAGHASKPSQMNK